jgi:hypothetical protein
MFWALLLEWMPAGSEEFFSGTRFICHGYFWFTGKDLKINL